MKTFFYYFLIFLLFSIIIKLISVEQIIPVLKNVKKIRVFNILPLRELLIIPPISYIVLIAIYKYLKYEIKYMMIFIQSIIYMFITGIIIHLIFNVKTRLGFLLNITANVDGTGIAPYDNY
jgi:hypothetical protein